MENFWRKVEIRGETDCWPWNGCKRKTGHGQFKYGYRLRSSHAVALILSDQPQPFQNAHALHSCDNPPCCNPAHLRWGTHLENTRDMVARGRAFGMPGNKNPQSRLKENEVLRIFAMRDGGISAALIAKDFGVEATSIFSIWNGRTWTSVTGLTSSRRKRRSIDSATS